MSKRILTVLLIALIALFSLTACKNGTAKTGKSDSINNSKAASSADEKVSTSSSDSKKANKEESGSEDDSQSKTSSADSAQNSSEKTDGWKQQQGGTVIKGNVKANVVKYGSAKLSDGEQLIKELIEGGLQNPQIIDKQKGDNYISYQVKGVTIGSSEAEFVKFQFVSQKSEGYLVTVMAENEQDLNTDISYILDNLKNLAQ